MKSSFHSTFFLLVLTMLLMSACRTAHSVAKEESATHTGDTCHTSVASESSFASLFSALSLRADSIVMWMYPSETGATATLLSEDSCIASADTSFCDSLSGSTAQYPALPKRRSPSVAKILIGGLHVESVKGQQMEHTALARDSLAARESHDSSLSSSEESKPPNMWKLLSLSFIVFMLLGLIITFAVIGIRNAFKIK